MEKLLTIREVSVLLKVTTKTLRTWDNEGKLLSTKTIGGHRRYKESDINNFLGVQEDNPINESVCIYGRVSSHDQKQKGDLDRQCQRLSEYCAKKKYKVNYIIKDVGSGLNDSRTGLNKIFNLVSDNKITKIVIEHKDRLTRFQFNVFVKLLKINNVEIEYVEDTNLSDEEEFSNDVIMLIASFSGKLYGKRSHKNKK